jgi:hypothetical protein
MAFHAIFLPAFEGPDEPHHLARVLAFAAGPLKEAFGGAEVPEAVVGSVKSFPCSSRLAAAYGCPAFDGRPAAFNLLRAAPAPLPASAVANPEANQPPLAYAAMGLALRAVPAGPGVASALLYARLFSVGLVALAIFGPLRILARRWSSEAAAAGLLALLLPGASEALARASNDAAVFLWAAALLAALDARVRSAALVLLLAAGPLIKLTALPVVVFAVVALFLEGRRGTAVAGAAAALAVFPLQALRGWLWGGTIELNGPSRAIGEPLASAVLGFARSVYVFVKTTFWVGGWSFVRPAGVLTIGYFALLLAAAVACRRRPGPPRLPAHAAAFAAAAVGFTVFALANRRFYGGWGGVAGWYLWDWSPWLFSAAADLVRFRTGAARALLGAAAVFVLAANAAWLSASLRLYGG